MGTEESIMEVLMAKYSLLIVALVVLMALKFFGKITKALLTLGLLVCGGYFLIVTYGEAVMNFINKWVSMLTNMLR